MLFFDFGTPEERIKFFQGLATVLKGHNVTKRIVSYPVAKTLLNRNSLAALKSAEVTHVTQNMLKFEKCLENVTTHVFTQKVGQLQKC